MGTSLIVFDEPGVNSIRAISAVDRAACSSPNPTANLVGYVTNRTRVRSIKHWESSAFFVACIPRIFRNNRSALCMTLNISMR